MKRTQSFLHLLCGGCKSEEIEAVMKQVYTLQRFTSVFCVTTNRKQPTLQQQPVTHRYVIYQTLKHVLEPYRYHL